MGAPRRAAAARVLDLDTLRWRAGSGVGQASGAGVRSAFSLGREDLAAARGLLSKVRAGTRPLDFAEDAERIAASISARPQNEGACTGVLIDGLAVGDPGPWLILDMLMSLHLLENEIPNAQLSVMSSTGRLVFSHAYTNCEVTPPDGRVWATPYHRFRIGSVSKLFTALAAMQLIEGRMGGGAVRWMRQIPSLSARAADLMDLATTVSPVVEPDPRLGAITVDQLLCHTVGWDRNTGDEAECGGLPGDITHREVADALSKELPVDATDWVRYLVSQPLTLAPGTCYTYSNDGYIVLGRLIEEVSGMSVAEFVQTYILDVVGTLGTEPGDTANRQEREVRYYGNGWPADPPNPCGCSDDTPDGQCDYGRTVLDSTTRLETRSYGGREVYVWAYPGERECVYKPYGDYNLATGLASGGWISTTNDLLRVFRELLPSRQDTSPILSSESIDEMFTTYESRNGPVTGNSRHAEQAIGWLVQLDDEKPYADKAGHLRGAHAYIRLSRWRTELDKSEPRPTVPRFGGFTYLLNRHPYPGCNDDEARVGQDGLRDAITQIVDSVTDWTGGGTDLFDYYDELTHVSVRDVDVLP